MVLEKIAETGTKRAAQTETLIPAEVETSAISQTADLDTIGQGFWGARGRSDKDMAMMTADGVPEYPAADRRATVESGFTRRRRAGIITNASQAICEMSD